MKTNKLKRKVFIEFQLEKDSRYININLLPAITFLKSGWYRGPVQMVYDYYLTFSWLVFALTIEWRVVNDL